MTVFQCKNCKYRFNTRGEKKPSKCPYCEKTGTLIVPMNAEDIIKDVDDLF